MSNENIEMILQIENGRVIMRFKEPVSFVAFDPKNITEIACSMTDLAFEADTGLKPAGNTLKAELIERHRKMLTRRIELMLNSLRENRKKSNQYISTQVVEACLKEIF